MRTRATANGGSYCLLESETNCLFACFMWRASSVISRGFGSGVELGVESEFEFKIFSGVF